jgi:hypothetical protein
VGFSPASGSVSAAPGGFGAIRAGPSGNSVTVVALPLIAVEVLDADSTMGLLVAAVWLPWLLVGLPVCNDGGPVQEAAWAQGSGGSGGDSGGFCRPRAPRYRSASRATAAPVPAAVMAWPQVWSTRSPSAKTPGMYVRVETLM